MTLLSFFLCGGEEYDTEMFFKKGGENRIQSVETIIFFKLELSNLDIVLNFASRELAEEAKNYINNLLTFVG